MYAIYIYHACIYIYTHICADLFNNYILSLLIRDNFVLYLHIWNEVGHQDEHVSCNWPTKMSRSLGNRDHFGDGFGVIRAINLIPRQANEKQAFLSYHIGQR